MAFLGIRIPHEMGRLISKLKVPGDKQSPSEYHITILCFEDNWPLSELTKSLEATYQVVSKIVPFGVKAKKVSHFPPREGKPTPIIAPVDSDDLQDLRKKLARQFQKDNIEFDKTFKEYKPHITLAYSEEGHDDYKIDPPIEFVVNELVLWGGDSGDDRLFITFPLKGPEKIKRSLLLQKTDLFYKLAHNPGNGLLTPSREGRMTER
jgi:2'-5' RNA ligase